MKLTKNDSVISEILDGEICIFNPKNAEYINLNSTGTRIWELLDSLKDINEIIQILKTEYKDQDLNIEKETKLFIDDCIKNNILVYRDR